MAKTRQHRPSPPKPATRLALAAAWVAAVSAGCAGNVQFNTSTSDAGATQLAQQLSATQAIQGARISFHFSDYYTLTQPNAEGCAGDARNYFDPVALFIPNATVASNGYTSVQGVPGLSTALGVTGNTGPMLLPSDVTNSDQTIKPDFIKNVSVDMTDANSLVTQNRAAACSLGQAAGTPATSSCATFDYGAIGGIPTSMGGTMLVIGGVQNYNYSGILPPSQSVAYPFQGMSLGCGSVTKPPINGVTAVTGYTICDSGVYALGVDTLPASAFDPSNPTLMPSYQGTQGPTGSVSTWANLSGAQGYTGPMGGAGASAVYDPGLQQVLLFGGAAPLAGFGSSAPGVTTYDTWIFDLKSQLWSLQTQNVYVATNITNLYDTGFDFTAPASGGQPLTLIAPTPIQPPKPSGARAFFGYVAMPGMGVAVNALNPNVYHDIHALPLGNPGHGTMSTSMIDRTDRLMIIGGLSIEGGSTSPGVSMGTHRFNPTYGPEVQNVIGMSSPAIDTTTSGIPDVSTATPQLPVQYMDSYHTQLLDNSYGGSFVAPGVQAAAPAPQVPAAGPVFLPYSLYSSHFSLDLPPISVGPTGGQPIIGSGFAPVTLTSGGKAGAVRGTGYLLGSGGFDYTTLVNAPDTTITDPASRAGCTTDGTSTIVAAAPNSTFLPFQNPYGTNSDLRCGGGLAIQTRFYANTANTVGNGAGTYGTQNENNTSYWSAITNFLDVNTVPATPAIWNQVAETPNGGPVGGATSTQIIPLLGGISMLPGFNINQNEIVSFGGIDCIGYVSNTASICNGSFFKNPGSYRIFGKSPADVKSATAGSPLTPVAYPDLAGGTSSIPTDSSANWGGAGLSMNNAPATAPACTSCTTPGVPPPQFAPTQAGMATARGVDPAGNIIILAWGGANGAATVEGLNRIYFLTETAGVARWGFAEPALQTVTGATPAELINSAMVYSHVSGKFYVFGGYDPSTQMTSGSTYEITITSNTTPATACVSNTGNCLFTWRQLNQSTGIGLTCYPSSCPPGRRSHKMAEVNYFNRNPGGIGLNKLNPGNPDLPVSQVAAFDALHGGAGYENTGEQPCNPNAPCSYGIFMEGGTPDGINYLSDRWMFDPTANGGNGNWQLMNEFPPRTLAAMADVDYALPVSGQVVHRAIVFGGETGLNNSTWAPAGFFVAPTLGDTWMYDYDAQSWNRVQLQGVGYNGFSNIPTTVPNSTVSASEFTHRQAFDALGPSDAGDATQQFSTQLGQSYMELSPPPLSGAVMVTRTQAPPAVGAPPSTTPLITLPLPEIFMFGGRLKDGSFNPLSNTYKFCAGTTGEAFAFPAAPSSQGWSSVNPNDFICDAFDPLANPYSPSPVTGYLGRWLSKVPDGVTTTGAPIALGNIGSYLGAGAYDTVRDRIVLFGGLTSLEPLAPGSTAVTDTTNLVANSEVFEYTPPQPQLGSATPTPPSGGREGRWTFVPACAGYPAPVGRYGHSLSYNTRGQNLLLLGGYSANGTPLTQTVEDQSVNYTYNTPEVWTGTYCSDAQCSGLLPAQTPIVTLTNTPCYFWQEVSSFGNSSQIQSELPPETGLAHAASVYIPATGFNSGYYSMFDNQCTGEGPIASPDPSVNKLLAGGAYIDIDRTQLGANENLLLNLTFIPMGPSNVNPDQTALTTDETAVFRVHLIKTGQTAQQLQAALQPRYMTYANTQEFPETVQSLSVMAPPTGQITQQQVVIPLTTDPGIDRIRIERYSGTGILLDAAIYRMGSK